MARSARVGRCWRVRHCWPHRRVGGTYLLLPPRDRPDRPGLSTKPLAPLAGEPVVLVSDIGHVANQPPSVPSVGVSPWLLAYQSGGASITRRLAWVDRSGADVSLLSVDASVQGPQLSPDGLLVAGSRLQFGIIEQSVGDRPWPRRIHTDTRSQGLCRPSGLVTRWYRLAFRRSSAGSLSRRVST